MNSLYLGILLVLNHTGFTSHIYINNDYILNVGIMNVNPQDSNSTRYTLYILDKKEIITTGMVENTRKVSPLLPYKKSWRSEEIVSLDEQIKGAFEPFAGFNCLKIEEKKSFPPLLSPSRNTRTIHHLICSKEEFAEKINYPHAIPYIPVQRKNLEGKYSEYEFVLASYMVHYDEEYGLEKHKIFELEKLEETLMPMDIIKNILAKPIN
jgi:hypothetical protein